MEIFSFLIVFVILFMLISIFLGLLSSPFFWVFVLFLFGYGMIRRYLFRKRMEEYTRQQEQQYESRREQYYSNFNQQQNSRGDTSSKSSTASGDVIDVDYEVVDEKTND